MPTEFTLNGVPWAGPSAAPGRSTGPVFSTSSLTQLNVGGHVSIDSIDAGHLAWLSASEAVRMLALVGFDPECSGGTLARQAGRVPRCRATMPPVRLR